MREAFEEAVSLIGMDITSGRELWTRFRDFELDELEDLIDMQAASDTVQDGKRRLIGVIRRQLSHPLIGNEQVLKQLDEVLADVFVESDVNIINPSSLSAAFAAGVDAREGRLLFEDNVTSPQFLKKTPEEREQGWRAYIAFETKDNQLFRAQRLYDRALICCPESYSLWRQYIHFASDTVKNAKLLDLVTRRATRVPVCMPDVDIWRLRFLALELNTTKTVSASTSSKSGEDEGFAGLAYGILQTAMRCSFSCNEDYLVIMKIYCDSFRRALSAVVTVGAVAVDIISYINTLIAALDFIENYLWSYFPQWVEGWVLFALYRTRIEDGIIEDISCSVDGEINGTHIVSRATEVWDRLFGSAHGRCYLVWKAAIAWAIATRKDGDYIRKLCKKAVVIMDNTPTNFIHLDVFSSGRNAIVYSQSLLESPQESLLNKWLEFEEENGSPDTVQLVANRRFKVLGQTKPSTTNLATTSNDASLRRNSKTVSKAESIFSKKRAAALVGGECDAVAKEPSRQKSASISSRGEANERVPKRARKEIESESISQTEINVAEAAGDIHENRPTHTVFVKNLAFSATEADIREVFAECGDVIGAEVLTNTTGKSKGMAYVHFTSAAAVGNAMRKHNAEVAGRPISVEYLREGRTVDGQQVDASQPAFHPTTLFVSKLPREVTDEGLRECFEKAVAGVGSIEACKIVRDKRSGHSKVSCSLCWMN